MTNYSSCPSGYGIVAFGDGKDPVMTCCPVPEPSKFFVAGEVNNRVSKCDQGEIITAINDTDPITVTCQKVTDRFPEGP